MVTNTLDLRVWNNDYTRWLPIRGYINAEFNDECGFTAPTGTLTVTADHPRATRLMQ